MKLFDIVGGKVTIHPEGLSIPAFKTLWENAGPEEATKEITYIILKNKWDSPYVLSIPEEELESTLKSKVFGDSKYTLSVDGSIAEKEYIEIHNTRTLKMLTNIRLKLDSISDYYRDSLDETLDEKKIKDLLAGIASVEKVYQSIQGLEDMVKAGEIKKTKVKGDAKINPFELPDV